MCGPPLAWVIAGTASWAIAIASVCFPSLCRQGSRKAWATIDAPDVSCTRLHSECGGANSQARLGGAARVILDGASASTSCRDPLRLLPPGAILIFRIYRRLRQMRRPLPPTGPESKAEGVTAAPTLRRGADDWSWHRPSAGARGYRFCIARRGGEPVGVCGSAARRRQKQKKTAINWAGSRPP